MMDGDGASKITDLNHRFDENKNGTRFFFLKIKEKHDLHFPFLFSQMLLFRFYFQDFSCFALFLERNKKNDPRPLKEIPQQLSSMEL